VNCHPDYDRLVDLAGRAHQAGRCAVGLPQKDIDRARLYSYAFRLHVIGTFHATQVALRAGSAEDGNPLAAGPRSQALHVLQDLANRAMDPIQPDARALLSTFWHYDRGIRFVAEALGETAQGSGHPRIGTIAGRFTEIVGGITGSNGIYLTRDTEAPEQASFVVPNLGITIVPLVYGDYHSWNLAYLAGERRDVPCHRHHEGVEIHLGFSPLHGDTILGQHKAEIKEGYAMPIPPLTAHGFVNRSDLVHHVPFIFGSLKAGGWGVFLGNCSITPGIIGDRS